MAPKPRHWRRCAPPAGSQFFDRVGGQKASSFRPRSFGTTHSLFLSLSLSVYPITASRASKKNLGPVPDLIAVMDRRAGEASLHSTGFSSWDRQLVHGNWEVGWDHGGLILFWRLAPFELLLLAGALLDR
jgi:hypothetical protein